MRTSLCPGMYNSGVAVDYLTPFIADVNGFSEGSLWNTKNSAKVFSDAGVTPITSGGAIQQVNDLCSRANHLVQATAGRRPTWTGGQGVWSGGPTAPDTGGTFDVMRTATAGSSSRLKTLFASFTPTGTSDGWLFGPQTGNNSGLGVWHTDGRFEWYTGGTSLITPAGTFPTGTRATIMITVDGSGGTAIYANGLLSAIGTCGLNIWNMVSLGTDGAGTSPYYSGAIQGAGWVEGVLTGGVTTLGQAPTGQLSRCHLALANL